LVSASARELGRAAGDLGWIIGDACSARALIATQGSRYRFNA